MCTLIVLHRCLPGRPLVVAANRDEFLARPAEDFAIRETASGRILSPMDLEAGGTWLGLNHRGVFAGLTNLRPASLSCASGAERVEGDVDADGGQGEVAPVLLSRGEVVMAALEADSASAAARSLEDLAECSYNPFQLLIADELLCPALQQLQHAQGGFVLGVPPRVDRFQARRIACRLPCLSPCLGHPESEGFAIRR